MELVGYLADVKAHTQIYIRDHIRNVCLGFLKHSIPTSKEFRQYLEKITFKLKCSSKLLE